MIDRELFRWPDWRQSLLYDERLAWQGWQVPEQPQAADVEVVLVLVPDRLDLDVLVCRRYLLLRTQTQLVSFAHLSCLGKSYRCRVLRPYVLSGQAQN
jgi:hypothetical protein